MRSHHQNRPHSIQITQRMALLLVTILLFPALSLRAVPLSGNYTINQALPTGGTNFHFIADFANSLAANGISGNVTATIAVGSGPYVEQVVFQTITGSGPNAVVTLEGNGEVVRFATTSTDRHVIRLSNVTYFTINNVTVERDPTSTGGFYGIHIFGTGQHITISNCFVDMTGTNSTLYGAYIASGSLTSILETGDFHYLSFLNNTSTGGGYGVSVFGLLSNLASNILINGNYIYDAHSNGVYLRETNGAVISNNYFNKMSTVITGTNAIQMAQAANINALIFNNFIEVSQVMNGTMTIRGIYLFNGTGHRVYNNVIHNIQLQSGNFTGIEVRTGATAPEICFNTISVDNTATSSGNIYGIKEELSNTNSVLKNNVISLSQPTTGTKSGLVIGTISTPTTAFNSDYNILWVPGGNTAQKGTLTTITYYPTLSDWQNISGQDMNSLVLDPTFVSPALSIPTNPLADNEGTPIAWVTTDVLGALRGNPPDIGAYEFSPAPPAAPDTILGDTSVCSGMAGLSYSVSPVPGASTYVWTVAGGATLTGGQGTPAITVLAGTSAFTVSVMAQNAAGNSPVTSLSVNVLATPVVTLALAIDTVCLNWPPMMLSGGTPATGNYSGPGMSAGVFTPSMAGPGNHPITYTYIAPNGCAASATDTLTVDVCTGYSSIPGRLPDVQICPNPANGFTTLLIPKGTGPYEMALFNSEGSLLTKMSSQDLSLNLDLSPYPRGIYLIRITDKAGRIANHLLISQ